MTPQEKEQSLKDWERKMREELGLEIAIGEARILSSDEIDEIDWDEDDRLATLEMQEKRDSLLDVFARLKDAKEDSDGQRTVRLAPAEFRLVMCTLHAAIKTKGGE